MTEQLKPCPFCGGEAELQIRGKLEGCCFIVCQTCCFERQFSYAGSAIRKWNNRPYENKLKADAVQEAHDTVLKVLVKQYTTPDPHCFEVLGMLSLYADKVKEGDIE